MEKWNPGTRIVLVLIGSYLLVVFVVPVALSAFVSYRALPVGRRCALCGGDTLQLVDRRLRIAGRVLPVVALQHRWCLCCGWDGITRLPRKPFVRRARSRRGQTPRVLPAPAAATQTLDVRSLDVDGAPWRVMLQCWTATGLFYGRLVFVAPSGRLWLDAVEAFSGADEHEVLGQALSLPEPLLTNRLRRLVR